jgi:acetyl-CoA carboxylase carboxyl transferase subunit beta
MPVGVGFGIRDGATAARIAAVADAVVIGSRIIEEIEKQSKPARYCRACRAARAASASAMDAVTDKRGDGMSWLQKLLPPKIKRRRAGASRFPEGLWSKCPACEAVLYSTDLENNQNVCPKCSHHSRLRARMRLDALLDAEGRFEIGAEVLPVDPLKFKDSKRYVDRLNAAADEDTGEGDAHGGHAGRDQDRAGGGRLFRVRIPRRLDGRGGGRALRARRGGGRTAACLHLHHGERRCAHAGRPVLPDADGQDHGRRDATGPPPAAFHLAADRPDHGRCFGFSFAFIGDIVIAEPGALIGFAGPRVIEQTVRETLPEGFQRAEFLVEKGAIDMIVDRRELRDRLASLLTLLQRIPAV